MLCRKKHKLSQQKLATFCFLVLFFARLIIKRSASLGKWYENVQNIKLTTPHPSKFLDTLLNLSLILQDEMRADIFREICEKLRTLPNEQFRRLGSTDNYVLYFHCVMSQLLIFAQSSDFDICTRLSLNSCFPGFCFASGNMFK